MHAPSEPGESLPAKCPLCKAVRSGQPCQTSTAFLRRRDGHSFAVECSSYPMLHDGFLRGAVVTFVDQKEQEHLHDQFRQQQKMEAIGRLAGGVAHDFNNLLTVILGQSEQLSKRLGEEPKLRAHAESIQKAAFRGSLLTRQLLAFGRKEVLQTVVLDLNEVLADLETLLRRLIGEDLNLETKIGSDPCWVRIDRGQIEQVIMNLAVN